jgi:cell division septum initiation protein DivIVA
VTEGGVKGRAKALFAAAPNGTEPSGQADGPPEALSDPDAQRQALQVLTLAQRTADEHLAGAQRQADKILADARGRAEEVVREAQTHANNLRHEADRTLANAHAAAEQVARDAQAHADETRQNAETVISEARSRAAEIAKEAQANADELKDQAQQRYQDVVGSLASKREALQEQIEALEKFDRDYRSRLQTFMQNQLRALWIDKPQVGGELDLPSSMSDGITIPAQMSQ